MEPIFFLHIPKTGGTSIRDCACRTFDKAKIFMLYGKDSATTHRYANKIRYYSTCFSIAEQLKLISDYITENDIKFYSSHWSASYLPCFNPDRAFSIFRQPYDQVLSYYYHQKSLGRTSLALEEFIEEPANQNIQTHAFGCADIDSIALVGILDAYDSFVARLNHRFGLNFNVVHRNRRSLISRLVEPSPRPSLRAHVERLNAADMDIYQRAAARWSSLAAP